MPDHLDVCEAAVRAGGRVLMEWSGRFSVAKKAPRDLVTEADVAAQREIRRIVLGEFPTHGFVGEESLSEAAADSGGSGGPRWIVDPLDGTSNYVHGFPAYCVSVALAQADEILVGAIYDPVRDECFTARAGGGAFLNGAAIRPAATTDAAEALVAVSFPPHVAVDSGAVADFLAVVPHVHSVRRTGSTAINLAYIACGRLDAFWVRRIASWDVAAGLLLVAEAGGVLGPFRGGRTGCVSLEQPVFIAAATPQLLEGLQRLLPA